MQKTIFAVIVTVVFVFSASGQEHKDSLQNKVIPVLPTKYSTQAGLLFLPPVIPANFYTTHLPFFCDKELKIQKAVKMPVKFRIGSLEDCDKLEGKP